MKRKLFVFMAFLFLISSSELHELARLPKLVSHFMHHRNEHEGLTLFHFLQLHYTANHPDDQDEKEDGQLPFRHTLDMACTDMTAVVPFFTIAVPFPPNDDVRCTCFPEGMPRHRASDIFRPPR